MCTRTIALHVQQFPWFTRVEFTANGQRVECAGAVLNESFVLTAASCFRKGPEVSATVTAGVVQSHLCENFRQSVSVKQTFIFNWRLEDILKTYNLFE